MIPLLEWIFASFERFIGVLILLYLIGVIVEVWINAVKR